MSDTTESCWLFPDNTMDTWLRRKAGFPVDQPEPTVDDVTEARTTIAGWVESGLLSPDVGEAFGHALAKPTEEASTDE